MYLLCFIYNSSTTIFNIVSYKDRQREKEYKVFKFDRKNCDNCKFKDKCLAKDKNGKFTRRSRDLDVPIRYDAILNDLHRVTTREFELAYNMRYKVERRFAHLAELTSSDISKSFNPKYFNYLLDSL